ncbi:MAG TPA: rod shape-determining protein MreC, partial [Rhodocyclaceae bacterium]|nr:rod shape-determining protein MreC [Rhodocyclaceae bacterium]
HLPAQGIDGVAGYFSDVSRIQGDNARLKKEGVDNAVIVQRYAQLELENQQLRNLLAVRERHGVKAVAARVLYTARDPFARRVVIDRGAQQGVVAGQPVIDDRGLVGQLTRVFPLVSEVTLATDKEHSIPVQIVRNGLRSVSFGLGAGQMELRYMPANADVQVGDVIVTSGLDGIYLPGFPVARVDKIERDASYSFARILCSPLAGVENHELVLLLDPKPAEPAKPAELEAPAPAADATEKPSRQVRRGKR